MKNTVKYFALTLSAFVLGMTINNFAVSNVPSRVAVVDVNQILTNSAEYKKINADHDSKIKNLKSQIISAKEKIDKETNEKKKKELTANYEKELNTKKTAIQKEYGTKLTAYDKKVSAAIEQKAKAGSYEIVLSKGVVFYGGTDITADVTKALK